MDLSKNQLKMLVSKAKSNALLIKLFFLIATSYIIYFFLIPPFTVNDESSHMTIVVSVAAGRYPYTTIRGKYNPTIKALGRLESSLDYYDHPYDLPDFSRLTSLKEEKGDYNSQGVTAHEAFLPPIYYLVAALFYYLSKITPSLLWQFYIIRLTSTLFYAGTVIVAWNLLVYVLKNRNVAASILLLFVLNPLVLKMGIGVNPDIALTFFSLLFLYLLIKFPANFSSGNVIKISMVSALSMLTKVTGIATNAGFALYMILFKGIKPKSIKSIILFQIVFLLIAFSWFLLAFMRYGTFFPQPFGDSCVTLPDSSMLNKLFLTFTTFRWTFMHYAGFMGWSWPHPFNWFFNGYVVLLVGLAAIGLFGVLREKGRLNQIILIYTAPYAAIFFILNFSLRLARYNCDFQGRYIMPIFLILCWLVFYGVKYIVKSETLSAKIIAGFAIFHYLFILFTVLLLRYYV